MAAEQALLHLSAEQLHIFSCLEALNCIAERTTARANSGQVVYKEILKTLVYVGHCFSVSWSHCQLFFKTEIAASLKFQDLF